jgi:hypothetical protein
MTASSAIVSAKKAYPAEAQRSGNRVTMEAPEDVLVLSVATNGSVKKGDILYTLTSVDVDRMAIELDTFSNHLEIAERPFKDGRVDAEIAFLKRQYEISAEIFEMFRLDIQQRDGYDALTFGPGFDTLHHHYNNIDDYLTIELQTTSTTTSTQRNPEAISDSETHSTDSKSPPSTASRSITRGSTSTGDQTSHSSNRILNPDFRPDADLRSSYATAETNYLNAKTAFDRAFLDKKDALDKLSLGHSKLFEYRKLLDRRRASLTITSSSNGNFITTAAPFSAVEKGNVLGELIA